MNSTELAGHIGSSNIHSGEPISNDFTHNSFRFIANDRLYAENTADNQDLYKQKIQKVLDGKYPGSQFEFGDVSDENERLAFTVNFSNDIDILEEN